MFSISPSCSDDFVRFWTPGNEKPLTEILSLLKIIEDNIAEGLAILVVRGCAVHFRSDEKNDYYILLSENHELGLELRAGRNGDVAEANAIVVHAGMSGVAP